MSARELLGRDLCSCGRCRRPGTERVVVGGLGEALRAELAGSPAVLLGDPRTLAACGGLAAEVGADVVDLEVPGETLHADDRAVERTEGILRGSGPTKVPVAVGSGTVNDLVKAACHRLRRPYVAVATAASMNGYTSAIAAITVGGLKSTLPSTPPRAVLASPRVLADAPLRLTLSGLADLLSKPVSSADWRLAHLLWDEPYCPTPGAIAVEAVEQAVAASPGLPSRQPGAVAALFEALLVSGISMAVAGTSSPASGGEHLISHYLDMTEGTYPRRGSSLHGEQVGVATRITTRLYREVMASGGGGGRAPGIEDLPARLAEVPEGVRGLFLAEGGKKLRRLGDPAFRVARIRERWEEIRSGLDVDLGIGERYSGILPSVGAPVTAEDLGISFEEMKQAYRIARWVRDRYTILDLADDLGLLFELEATVTR